MISNQNHFIVNIDDAIQLARILRGAGFKLQRISKGCWILRSQDTAFLGQPLGLGMMLIDPTRNTPRERVIVFDPRPPRHFSRSKIEVELPEPPDDTIWGRQYWRWGWK